MDKITKHAYQLNYLTWILSLISCQRRLSSPGDNLVKHRLFIDDLLHFCSYQWTSVLPDAKTRSMYASRHNYLTKDIAKRYVRQASGESPLMSYLETLNDGNSYVFLCSLLGARDHLIDKYKTDIFRIMMIIDGNKDYYLRYIGLNGGLVLLDTLDYGELNEIFMCTVELIKSNIFSIRVNPKSEDTSKLKWYYSLLPNSRVIRVKKQVMNEIDNKRQMIIDRDFKSIKLKKILTKRKQPESIKEIRRNKKHIIYRERMRNIRLYKYRCI